MYMDEVTVGEAAEFYNNLLKDIPELKDVPMSALYEVLAGEDPDMCKKIIGEMNSLTTVQPNIIAFPTKED